MLQLNGIYKNKNMKTQTSEIIKELLKKEDDNIKTLLDKYNKDFDYLTFHKDRYNFLAKKIQEHYKPGSRFLDIGSLFCYLLIEAKALGYESCGIDLDEYVKASNKISNDFNLNNRPCDLSKDQIPFSENYFDVIVFSEVLEHFNFHPSTVFLEMARVLKPGGKIIITTPNQVRLNNCIKMLIGRSINWNIEEDFWDGAHYREYTAKEIIVLAEKAGLRTLTVSFKNFNYPNIRPVVKLFNSVVGLLNKRSRGNLIVELTK